MKLTLEQILEEFPDKNFIVMEPVEKESLFSDHFYLIRFYLLEPKLKENGWVITSDEVSVYVHKNILNYSGDWRDSLRSRGDINSSSRPTFVLESKSGSWYRCSSCVQDNIRKGNKFCPDCGIKLNWVE